MIIIKAKYYVDESYYLEGSIPRPIDIYDKKTNYCSYLYTKSVFVFEVMKILILHTIRRVTILTTLLLLNVIINIILNFF